VSGVVAIKREVERMKAEGAAFALAREFFLGRAEPVPVEDIAMAKGVLCVEGPLRGCLARLVRQGEVGIIRVRAGIVESGQRRFAIAHEIGHWCLHAAYSQYFICTAADMRDYTGSPLEVEANIFASELLMPTGVFRPLAVRAEPRWEVVSGLARMFDTSLTSTAIRFVGLCATECAVAQVEASGVRWLRAGDRKAGLVYRRSGTAHRESLAARALRERRSLGPEVVPMEVWVEEAFRGRVVTVVEEAAYLEGYCTVLSLLTVLDAEEEEPETDEEMPSVKRARSVRDD
jgi:hypothetical protein